MDKEILDYKNEEYQAVVEDCQHILTQRIKNSRQEVILAYGEVGERIVNSEIYKKYAKGNQQIVQDLAKDIGISYSEASRAIQFYQKFCGDSPVSETIINQFEEGENISWNKIKTKYLSDGEKKPPQKTFYKLTEIKNAFAEWFENSAGLPLQEELDEFLRILTK